MATSAHLARHRLFRSILLIVAALMALAAVPALAAPAAAAPGKIDAGLRAELDDKPGETSVFYVQVRSRADLRTAARAPGRAGRAAAVGRSLRATADRGQAGLRAFLRDRKVKFTPFWIVNAVRVEGDLKLAETLAARPEVARIVPEGVRELPKPTHAEAKARVQAVEWNIERIRAPEVWSGFGDRGEGIVVANVDTGVELGHPAVTASYRGNLGDGTFDHNYNWFDPSGACGDPATGPCDNNAHGTHTMGTMVGATATDQIGVAPGARWIAAKGCEQSTCSDASLLASGQWILAPTDLTGANPRPDLAPHVVNNSWGSGPNDQFYREVVDAWVAAGIFPVFSNGNAGPSCGTAGSPGDFPSSYSVGAFDSGNAIASFSSRGPSAVDGGIKPDIAAPGVAVRSSVPGGGYEAFNGTSMAAPHVTGTIALLWSAAPSLIGQIDATRALLDDTAIDTDSAQCGGTADDNNVWGEGRLDALALVERAPRGPVGVLDGQVRDIDASPIAGAQVTVTGPVTRTATTDADGAWRLTVPVGVYTARTTAFGYAGDDREGIEVTEGATTEVNQVLVEFPTGTLSGTVRDDGGTPVAGAAVTLTGTPIEPVTSGADGTFSVPGVPEGEYSVRADTPLRCLQAATAAVAMTADGASVDLVLPHRRDGAGTTCDPVAPVAADAATVVPATGDDASAPVELPFDFTLYGTPYRTAHVSTNGLISFAGPATQWANGPIPSASAPNAAVYALWDDLFVDGEASVRTTTIGDAPNRSVVVEWRNVRFLGEDAAQRATFSVLLGEDGTVTYQYASLPDTPFGHGASATVGLEDAAGATAFTYSHMEPALTAGSAVRFSAPGPANGG